MALYQVEITVRLEARAHTRDEAIRIAQRAIKVDPALVAPPADMRVFGGAVATIAPDRE